MLTSLDFSVPREYVVDALDVFHRAMEGDNLKALIARASKLENARFVGVDGGYAWFELLSDDGETAELLGELGFLSHPDDPNYFYIAAEKPDPEIACQRALNWLKRQISFTKREGDLLRQMMVRA